MNETYECEGYLSLDANRAHLQEIHTLIRTMLTTRPFRLLGYTVMGMLSVPLESEFASGLNWFIGKLVN